jgi:phosphoglycolate phosphatase
MNLIIFDFDGVLADTFSDMLEFAQEACNELGIDHNVIPADLMNLEVMSFATFGIACDVPMELTGEFVRRCTEKFAQKKSPQAIFDGLLDVIRKLSKENMLFVVTGNTTENVNAFLSHHGLQDCFHYIYGVDIPGTKAEKIKKITDQFDAENETILFVGDSLSDIHAAREANVRSVAVSWGHQTLEMLVRGKPDVIIHKPAEIFDCLFSG